MKKFMLKRIKQVFVFVIFVTLLTTNIDVTTKAETVSENEIEGETKSSSDSEMVDICEADYVLESDYDGNAAVSFANSHMSSGHSGDYSCPNGWQCNAFVEACLNAGGLNISLGGTVRTLYNGIKNKGTLYTLTKGSESSGCYCVPSSGNAANLVPGDVIISYCSTCGTYLHAVLVSGSSGGYIYNYAHNSNKKNQKLWLSKCSKNHSTITIYGIHFANASVSLPTDTTKPVISNVQVSDLSAWGYRVTCTVTDDKGVDHVDFPTWTKKSVNENEQDDLINARGTRNGNTYTYYVNTSDHNREIKDYITHIYAYDEYGNYSMTGIDVECVLGEKQNIGDDVYVTIYNSKTDQYVTYSDNGNVFVSPKKAYNDNQIWRMVKMDDGSYSIIAAKYDLIYFDSNGKIELNYNNNGTVASVSSGKCMDVTSAREDVGTNIQIYTTNNLTNQRYDIFGSDKGYYIVPNCGVSQTFKVHPTTGNIETDIADISDYQIFKIEKYDMVGPTISNIQISNLDSTGYTVTCTVTDSSGIGRVEFPSWTSYNGDDDKDLNFVNGRSTGTYIGNNQYQYRVKISDHNNEYGEYVTQIYSHDNAGNWSTSDEVKVTVSECITKYKVNISISGNGEVNGAGNYADGSTVVLKAKAKANSKFVGWYDGSVLVSLSDNYTITVKRNISYNAIFEVDSSSNSSSNVTDTQIGSFVKRMYTVALSRDAETQGLNDWSGQLSNQEIDGAGIANGFINSVEFKNRNLNNNDYLDVLYRTFFDREADAGGKVYWMDKLQKGISRTEVLSGFVNSQEFSNLCDRFGIARGTMQADGSSIYRPGVRGYVLRMYTKALNRDGETVGVEDWTNRINTKVMSPEAVAKSFFSSQEFINRNLNNADYVETLYQTFMDRASDEGGKQYWMNKLNSGMSRQQVLEGFSRSEEFSKIMKRYGL